MNEIGSKTRQEMIGEWISTHISLILFRHGLEVNRTYTDKQINEAQFEINRFHTDMFVHTFKLTGNPNTGEVGVKSEFILSYAGDELFNGYLNNKENYRIN